MNYVSNTGAPANAKRALIIGAGFTGLAAAYQLAKLGIPVTVLERDSAIGGLAGSFELRPGVHVEKFYHHWFTSDADILQLISELGASENLIKRTPGTGMYFANSVFRLTTPLDLLRYPAISVVDRIRTGLMTLNVRRIDDWRRLEGVTAKDWLIANAGLNAYRAIWEPLLAGKFGPEAETVSAVWIWNKLKLRGGSRGKTGKECLLYYRGGFAALAEMLRRKLSALGVTFLLDTAAEQIVTDRDCVIGVQTAREFLPADAVLATVPLPVFSELTPSLPTLYREQLSRIRYLGNMCLVLRLRQSLSAQYWINIADPTFPFVGLIEHTNLDSAQHYGGEHIVYLSRYLSTADPLFALSDQQWFEHCLPYLKQMFPAFDTGWVIGHTTWRDAYSQPVITTNYSENVPSHCTPIDNLWLATMAQIYPQDRGTNYAVRAGREVAVRMAAALQEQSVARLDVYVTPNARTSNA